MAPVLLSKDLLRMVGAAMMVFCAAVSDSSACSLALATADVTVYQDPETGETIEVHASAVVESGVVFSIVEKCEYISEKYLCPESVKGN